MSTGDRIDAANSEVDFDDLKPTIEKFSDVAPELRKILYDYNNNKVETEFRKAEAKTGMKREHIMYLLGAILGVYLIFGDEAGFLCNLIGFVYPAGASIAALHNRSRANTLNWLCYWILFGFLSLIDSYAKDINSEIPIYWLAKAFILLFLMLPQTRGAQRLHTALIGPQYAKLREFFSDEENE